MKMIKMYLLICFRKGVFMKRNVFNLSLGVLCVFLFSSCLDDGDDIFVSYGVIQNASSSNNYEILTDKGNTLVVTKSYTGQTIENDKRVLVNFEILSDKDQNKNIYEIQVNGFYSLLSKPLVNESFILKDEKARRDSIGNDPFNTISAKFGGDYLNINFEFLAEQGSNKKHMINLVYDDMRADADTIYLRLYHNAYDEVKGKGMHLYKGMGRCSFKISDLLPEGVTSKPVRLTWTEYYGYNETIERSGTDVFKTGNASDKGKIFQRISGLDNYVEIK